MAKDKKRSGNNKKGGGESAPVRMAALYEQGDVAAARAVAARLSADASASETERAEAGKLLERATIDGRAIQIFGLAVALAVLVVGVFLLQ